MRSALAVRIIYLSPDLYEYINTGMLLHMALDLSCPLSLNALSSLGLHLWQDYTLEEAKQGASGEEKKSQKPSSDRCPYSLL